MCAIQQIRVELSIIINIFSALLAIYIDHPKRKNILDASALGFKGWDPTHWPVRSHLCIDVILDILGVWYGVFNKPFSLFDPPTGISTIYLNNDIKNF